MEQLDRYREQLKVCDEKILQGLLERNRVVEEIMACKEKNGMKILQPDQEARQEAWLEEALKGCRHQEEVRAVFDRIHWGSKRIQARKYHFRVPEYAFRHGCGGDGSADCPAGGNVHRGHF